MKIAPRRRTPKSCVIEGDYDEQYYRFDSRKDLGLAIESLSIALPQIKDETSSPYGMNGIIDDSEYIGNVGGFNRIFYEARKIKIVFGVEKREKYYYALDNYDLKGLLHGKVREITFADDPDYFYRGRVSITSWDPYAIIPHITVEMVAHPFKKAHSPTDSGEHGEVPFLGLLDSDLELDSTRTTASTNTIANGSFTIRGVAGSVSVWRATIRYEGRFVLTMERGMTDVRYGGRWELRDESWNKISPFGIENASGETKTIYIVFYCDYEVNYSWRIPDLIDCTTDSNDVFTFDVGEEPVYPVIYASHDNCVMVDMTQQQVVPLAKGTEPNYNILLEPGKHELCFCCKRVSASEDYSFRLWVQRGYI